MRTYIYNDERINLGELGEHELQITAVNVAQAGDEPSMVIKRAMAHVKLEGYPIQNLDVTGKIRIESEWIELVEHGYRKVLERQFEELA